MARGHGSHPKAETARRDQERAARASSYEPDRVRARLALLEQQAVLAMDTEERDGIAAGERYPLMPEEGRQRRLAELDRKTRRAGQEDRLHQCRRGRTQPAGR